MTQKSNFFLKKANFDCHNHILVVDTAGGDYTYHAFATSLRDAFRLGGQPAASMNTSHPIHQHSSFTMVNQKGNSKKWYRITKPG